MKNYSYEYFCGANVYVYMNGKAQTDVAGISYEVIDSSTPIYGYSSRLFDAVAPGQKLVRGSFVVNYKNYKSLTADLLTTKFNVKQTYDKFENTPATEGLSGMTNAYNYHSEEITKQFEKPGTGKIDKNKEKEYHEYLARVAYSGTYNNYDGLALAEMLHEDYGFEDLPMVRTAKQAYSSLDATMMGPFNIKISFNSNNEFEIVSCYVNNFGSTIQISEEVILQEFSFFGRNIIYK